MTRNPGFRIEDAGWSHVGVVRSVNEDVAIVRPSIGLWAIADGAGGYGGGGWCADTIARACDTVASSGTRGELIEQVVSAIHNANDVIFTAVQRADSMMGATVAALVVHDHRFVILWVGDSRVYRYRNGRLQQITTDHSQVEHLVERGLLDREDVDTHPLRHVLSRMVGATTPLLIDRIEGDVEPDDAFLLCSDGLSDELGRSDIEEAMALAGAQRAVDHLIDNAINCGARDNITAVVVRCHAS